MTVHVSVVIPARNDADGLRHAVAASLAQTGVDVDKVLVCVGPSSDDTEAVAHDLARSDDRVHVLDNAAGGISAALNLGLRHVESDVFVRIDARCRPAVDYIAGAVATMTATGAANVGAVQVPTGQKTIQNAIAAAMAHPFGSGAAAYRSDSVEEPRQVTTAFLGVYNTSALRSVGGWDEDFARNEDAELNRRLIDAGHQVWLDPRLRVEYQPRATLRGLARQYFDYGWWRRRTASRHRRLELRQLASPAIVLAVPGALMLAATVWAGFIIVPVAYFLLLIGAALTARRPVTMAERAIMVMALSLMHFAWGAGFWASLIRGPWRVPPHRPPAATSVTPGEAQP